MSTLSSPNNSNKMNSSTSTSVLYQARRLVKKSNVQAYWHLLLALTMPVRWARWLIMVGVILLTLGGCFYFLINTTTATLHPFISFMPQLAMIMGAVLCAIFPIMAIFVLPSQMLTLASSKSFALLTNLRLHLALLLASFLVILSIVFSIAALKAHKLPVEIFGNFLIFFTIASTLILISIYATYRFPMAQFFFGLAIMVVAPLFNFLKSMEMPYQLLFLLVEWCVFLSWWLNWRPQKYHRSLLIEGMNSSHHAQQLQLNLYFMQLRLSKKAKSWFGSRFLGRSDSAIDSLYTSFFGFAFGIAVLCLTFFIVLPRSTHRDSSPFLHSSNTIIFIYAVIIAYSYGAQLTTAQLANFKKTWLYFMGDRTQLFHKVENLCTRQYLIQISAAIIPVTTLLLMFPNLRPIAQPFFLGFGLGITQTLFHVYLNLWMYQKFGARRNWISNINIATTLLVFVPCAALAAFPDFLKAHWEFFSFAFTIYLMGIILLRQRTKHNWATIDLVEAR